MQLKFRSWEALKECIMDRDEEEERQKKIGSFTFINEIIN